ncbi:MAG: squalene synthase HpnC [Planctomycetota bacterium]
MPADTPPAMPTANGPPPTLAEAQRWVASYTAAHRENFAVMSRLLPSELRSGFAAVYAYCRFSDDLADDPGDAADRLGRLADWREGLEACFAGRPGHPIFVALAPEIETHGLTVEPFGDLLDAFVQDQTVTRYDDRTALLEYCRRSANPVGRIVLRLFGGADGEADRLSDATCTGLQLVNFWQDVRRDALERDRGYVPRDVALRHGLDVDALMRTLRDGGDPAPHAEAFGHALEELCAWTETYFRAGRGLWGCFTGRRGYALRLFTLGGESILRKVGRAGAGVLWRRPSPGKASRVACAVRALPGLWALSATDTGGHAEASRG